MEQELKQLIDLAADQKSFVAKIDEELKSTGKIATETKGALDTIRERLDKVQTQLDAVDKKSTERLIATADEHKSIGQMVLESKEFLEAKERQFRGKVPVTINMNNGAFPEHKTNITDSGLGSPVTGVVPMVRIPGITITAQQELRIRDLMRVRTQSTGNTFDWVYQSTRTNVASPQTEASAKSESTYNWAATSGTIRTLAHFLNVSRQALDDNAWLRSAIDSELMYGLKIKEEAEILAGSGSGVHLNGIITQATVYDTGLNVASDTKLDKLRHAKLQARLAGLATYAPSAFVLHPTDMHTIELIKDQASNVGNYVIGDPKGGAAIKTVWGLPVVESDSITAGTFLVGAFNSAAEIVDRMAATIEISFEHSSNFTANLATILCEERLGLAVSVPTAFISGSY
jgi:HK97 family phage major capsid protein